MKDKVPPQNQSEKELLLYSEKLLNSGSWTFHLKTGEVTWSENMYNIFGITPHQKFLYEDYLNLLNEKDREEIQTKVEKAIRLKEPYEVFQTIQGKNIHGIGVPILGDSGEVTLLHGVIRDITKEVKKNKSLSELAVVVEKTNNVVIITNKDGYITWGNQGFTELTGFTLKEALGKKPGKLLQGPETDKKTVQELSLAIKQKKPITREILNYCKEGNPYWLHLNIEPIFNCEGECISFVAIELDLTENHKQQEIQEKLTKELQKALAERDQLFSLITHDLRSPFNSLIGYTDLALECPEDLNKEELLETMAHLNSISKDTLSFIDDFLLWITKQSHEKTVTYEEIDLLSLIREVSHLYSEIALFKKIDLEIKLRETKKVFTHAPSLKAVLRNLLSNSIKFYSDSDQISIDVKEEENFFLLTVSDSGPGLTRDAVTEFNKGRVLSSQVGTKGEKGLGLGLMLVTKLIQDIGGDIKLSSEKGNGSTFKIKLPKDLETKKEVPS